MSDHDATAKAGFLSYLGRAWAALQETLDGFNEEQMTQQTDAVGWTVKDHLGHLVSWEEGIIALLLKEPRYPAMGIDFDTMQSHNEDEVNQIMRGQMSALSLAEVRERLASANAELAAVVTAMEASELLKGYSHFQPDEPGKDSGAPVLGWVVGNSSGHYEAHLPWMKELAGQE